MKTTLTTLVMALLFAVTVSYGQTGAFASDCPTMEQQQAAYNQQKANGIIVINTSTQQLQCYYQQLATYWNQLHKTKQQADKEAQQIAKDTQQIGKDKQQVERDAYLGKWQLELTAREAILKECEEEHQDIKVFCNELKLIIEKTGTDKELSDHCKLRINHSGLHDDSNPGSSTQDNGGILNPSN